ncbi:3-hydroxyacyl-CoA dehydrogenase family protein [Georgenia thermotolerans]|uniref:3-hydroxyacyl-CoA dehydrogenase family protein n=1 Tax=Georgenia thermotolerans TaxID=527326 RepID=A0A7J5UT35_9MICO|nr:3-hydroxyacyl-CoA dehydrogenase family protein [Georgenia thermotolerans]KAE8765497.1 3-hydroxyacyl-CoA dehydrogenase family protein [Georgenia thermotolerans]
MTFTLPTNIENRPAAVIGAGTLGRRIALMLADRGGLVRIYDLSADARDAAKAFVEEQLPRVVETVDGGRPGTVELTDDLAAAVADAWLVVEAVPEKLDLKREIFAELDRVAAPDAILASNSSSYASGDFIDDVAHPERVVNLHFYQPPVMNAADLMSSGRTDPAVLDLLQQVLPPHGIHPFVAHEKSTGFIFNRIWAAIKRECLSVVADGVSTPQDIDAMWKINWGTAFGPFELMDRVGLDVVKDIELHYIAENPALSDKTIKVLDSYLERGELGVKSGKGFYDHGEK